MVPQWGRGEGSRHNSKRSGSPPCLVRQRSISAAASTSRPKEFAEGLKRRIGSLRRR